MKHATRLLASVLTLSVAAYLGRWWYRVSHYSDWISHISIGDTKGEVLAVVGRPVTTNSPPDPMWCSAPDLSHEYMYGTAVFASWDVVGFNKHDKVVCKRELQSP